MGSARTVSDFFVQEAIGVDGAAIEIGELIRQLAARQKRWHTARLRAFRASGVTGPSDYQHLLLLHRKGGTDGLSMVEQAELLSTGHAATSKRLARFEEAGLVIRTDHPTDRRSHQWRLSCDGVTVVESASESIRQDYDRLVSHLALDQRQAVLDSLKLLAQVFPHQ